MTSENDENADQYQSWFQSYAEEAAKNAIAAFNEGYMLGVRHARKVLEDALEEEDEQN